MASFSAFALAGPRDSGLDLGATEGALGFKGVVG
jgi:hypothetical protein